MRNVDNESKCNRCGYVACVSGKGEQGRRAMVKVRLTPFMTKIVEYKAPEKVADCHHRKTNTPMKLEDIGKQRPVATIGGVEARLKFGKNPFSRELDLQVPIAKVLRADFKRGKT